jgi:VWFA-related protein
LSSAAIALNVSFANGQQLQQPRYAERVDVERVIIDVRVVDDSGQAVLGLGEHDFRVRIGGKPAAVQSIIWVGGGDAKDVTVRPQSVEVSRPGDEVAQGRLIVFLFQKDLDPSRIVGLMRLLVEAQGFLDGLTPNDRVAILSFDSHLKIWVDFTNDRERLLRVLKHGILFESPPIVHGTSPISLLTRLEPANARKTYTIEKALHVIADALHDLPGSKSVVLIGHGFGRLGWTGVSMEHGYSEARSALVAARASVFSLDVTNADYHSLEAGLQLVSKQTGGFFARTHLFIDQAMRRLVGALAGHYVLFVERPDLRSGAHRIEVDLTRSDVSVLARETFVQD